MPLIYLTRDQTQKGPNGWKVRGGGEIGVLRARMVRDQHTVVPRWTGYKG
jgi:hypothetical protein